MTRQAKLSLSLWGFVFATLCVLSSPKPIAGAARLMCTAAAALLKTGSLAVSRVRVDVTLGRGGQFFVKYPLMTVLQCVPAVALREAVRALAPNDEPLQLLA